MPLLPFIPRPVTGGNHIGRQGLVRDLRRRVANGESVAVIGGPKLGKTSLVRSALEGLADRRVIEMKLREELSPLREEMSGAILVLDNLDHLPVERIEALLARVSTAEPGNVILTGGDRLRAVLGTTSLLPGTSIRLYPLSVLLDGELRQLVGGMMVTSIAMWTGNHPYLAKLFLHYGEAFLSAGREQWEPLIRQMAEEIGEGAERRVLQYLIDCGKPVNPGKAAIDTGIEEIKVVADRLVYMGAISRWIRNDEATLFAGCRLLNNFVTGRPFDFVK
ncbi:MAG: ATP-binding protein [Nitrospira sp.]|nr:ATP-binding protein [Nitrospira sp.]